MEKTTVKPAKTREKTQSNETASLGTQLADLVYQSRRRVAIVLAIALAGLLGYHVMFGANGITAYRQKRSESRELQKEIQQLQQENSRLTEHNQHLKTDPDTIEHEARMILHYARPGEVIYKLNDKSPSAAQTPKP
jgi:cell division protein FtsB